MLPHELYLRAEIAYRRELLRRHFGTDQPWPRPRPDHARRDDLLRRLRERARPLPATSRRTGSIPARPMSTES